MLTAYSSRLTALTLLYEEKSFLLNSNKKNPTESGRLIADSEITLHLKNLILWTI